MPQRLLFLAFPALILFTVAATGCDSMQFVPSPTEELKSSLEPTPAETRVSTLPSIENPHTNGAEFISAKRWYGDEAEMVATAIRTQAGYDKIRVKIVSLGDSIAEGANSAAAMVRKAIPRKPRAVVVVVEDARDADLAAAVTEARAAGITVVLAGPPLAVKPGAAEAVATAKLAPLIVVGPVTFTASATDLVASALRNAKNAGIADRKSAVILMDTTADGHVPDRGAALELALKTAGIKDIQTFSFGHDVSAVVKKLTELLDANPKIGLVFATDVVTASAVTLVLDKLIPDRPFVASAYTWETDQLKSIAFSQFAAVAEYNPIRIARKAITAASGAILRGQAPATVDVPVTSQDSPPLSALSQSPTILAKQKPVESETPGVPPEPPQVRKKR
jgi:hypothetical protein